MSIINSLVEVKIGEEDDFLKIKETLTRIGIESRKNKKLYQSCHILHKQGKYYIVHFKELFALDNKPTDFTQEDRQRRNAIAFLLEEWGLIKIVEPDLISNQKASLNQIKILPYKEKNEWELIAKYNIGRKRN